MDSPRPSSEASTCIDDDNIYQPPTTHLLSDFDHDHNHNPTTTIPKHTPAPHTSSDPPDNLRLLKLIAKLRIALLILTILPLLICIPTLTTSVTTLLPVQFFTLFLTLILLTKLVEDAYKHVSVSITATNTNPNLDPNTTTNLDPDSHNNNSTNPSSSQDVELGSRRVAILVEDPVTGKQKWMLQPQPSAKNAMRLLSRYEMMYVDTFCGVVFLFSFVVSCVVGRSLPLTLAGVLVVRGAGIVVLRFCVVVNWRGIGGVVEVDASEIVAIGSIAL